MHFQTDDARFVIHSSYDPVKRQQTSEVFLPEGVEVHRRIPLEPRDVFRFLRGTKLRVGDYFSSAILPGWMSIGRCFFFVLTREE
jgi:hypothetical protein